MNCPDCNNWLNDSVDDGGYNNAEAGCKLMEGNISFKNEVTFVEFFSLH